MQRFTRYYQPRSLLIVSSILNRQLTTVFRTFTVVPSAELLVNVSKAVNAVIKTTLTRCRRSIANPDPTSRKVLVSELVVKIVTTFAVTQGSLI